MEVYLIGDMNINFLSYNSENKIADYLDTLFDLGVMPLITKTTRITDHTKTLIDHIYTNMPHKITRSGVCLADVCDHLPVFWSIKNNIPMTCKTKYYRDFSRFNSDLFLRDLESMDFNSIVDHDVNTSMNRLVALLGSVTDKHAPIRKVTGKKKKLLSKTMDNYRDFDFH